MSQFVFAFPDEWKPPTELLGATPRQIVMTGVGRGMQLCSLALMLAAVPIGLIFWTIDLHRAAEARTMQSTGVKVLARVTELFQTGGGKGGPIDHVRYEFLVNGHVYSQPARVSELVWSGLNQGQSYAVRYLSTNPEVSHPADWDGDVTGPAAIIAFPVMLLVMGSILWLAVRRPREILMQWLPAAGVVTQTTRGKQFAVWYQYRSQDGTMQSGRSVFPQRPVAGDVLCILFNPDQPSKSVPYLSVARTFRVGSC